MWRVVDNMAKVKRYTDTVKGRQYYEWPFDEKIICVRVNSRIKNFTIHKVEKGKDFDPKKHVENYIKLETKSRKAGLRLTVDSE